MTNNATQEYSMRNNTAILSHFWRSKQEFTVRDEAEDAEMLRRARIRSGDYMTTLATELERIADSLTADNSPEAHKLEQIITELLYLERNYKIVER